MRKALSLVLALVLAFGMCTVAFAAFKDVDDILEPNLYYIQDGNSYVPASEWDKDIEADYTLELWLNPYNFMDGSDHFFEDKGTITEGNLRTQKVTVRRSISKGGDLLNKVEFSSANLPSNLNFALNGATAATSPSGKTAYIKVEFVENFVSVNSKDFEYKIFLYLDGKKQNQTEFQVTGTMENPPEEVYEDDDYVSGEDGQVIKAEEYVRGIELYMGDGVSAWLNMFSGTKYYGTAKQEVSSADDAVLNQYPEIETVYVLRTVNVKSSSTKITFDVSDTYYVYNADGEYVGTTAEELPYSDKYYLATSRITMVEETPSTEQPIEQPGEPTDPATVDPQAPNMGGDDK